MAQAQTTHALNTTGDLTVDIGANPTSEDLYSVTHAPDPSFNDVFKFTLTRLSDSVSSAVSLEQPGLNGAPSDYIVSNGNFALFSDADGDGQNGTLISSSAFGNTSTALVIDNIAAGSYYWALTGNASGRLGGAYLFTTNTAATAAIPEPETYALMLAGLGLLGFVGRRRLHRSFSNFV